MALNRRQKILLAVSVAGGLTAVFTFLFLGRKKIIGFGRQVFNEAQKRAFKLTLPSAGRQYADDMLRVAREEGVSPFLIASIMRRETLFGTSRYLDRPGPGGRGDNGHGHGLMQIDDRSHGAFLAKGTWMIPYDNIKYATQQVIKKKLRYFKATPRTPGVTVPSGSYANKQGVPAGKYKDPRPLSGIKLTQATIAAYNTGELNVLRAIAAGQHPDTTTSGGNYSQDVLARASKWAAALQA